MDELLGTSARTMFCAFNRLPVDETGYPHDPDDFGRCVRLARRTGNFGRDMCRYAIKYGKEWKVVMDNWDEWEALLDEEIKENKDRCPRLYARMKKDYSEANIKEIEIKLGEQLMKSSAFSRVIIGEVEENEDNTK